ncbi:MAG: DPP IV N-terminal domain-containing protein, partial [Calditrichaeota bacterium]|nr:DPP IV N-terminal domain-containing protein [Calditrichota bacterium]
MRYLILISIYLFSFSQVKIEPTPEWIYSDANTLFKTASITWTSDIKALIYDQRITSQERSIELFDPASGKRETIVDAKKAVASLKKIHNHAADFLPEPDSYTSAGDKGLYEINGDLFVLTFSSSSFQRLTATEETEKSPSFSPDGNRVAFVRNNDLYVFDLKKNTEIRITESGGESLLNGTLSWVYWEEIFGRRDIGYWWSPDSKSIAFLESDESLVDLIYYVDFKPNVQRVFTQRYPKAGHTNPSVRIGINRVGSKSINWIDKNKFDYEYIIRVNWLPDNQRISVQTMNRKQDEVKLFFVKTDDLSASLIHTETDPGWINIHDDLHFL